MAEDSAGSESKGKIKVPHKFCPYCGHRNAASVDQCEQCGKDIAWIKVHEPGPHTETPFKAPKPLPKQKELSRRMIFFLFLGIGLLLIIVLVILLLVMGKGKGADAAIVILAPLALAAVAVGELPGRGASGRADAAIPGGARKTTDGETPDIAAAGVETGPRGLATMHRPTGGLK